MCAVCGVKPQVPYFAEIDRSAAASATIQSGASSYTAQVGFFQRTNLEHLAQSPAEVICVKFYTAIAAEVNATSNLLDVTWSYAGEGALNGESNLWQISVNAANLPGSSVLRADLITAAGNYTNAALMLLAKDATDCCAACVSPYPASLTITVQPGNNYLVNPLCHGTNNSVAALLSAPPASAVLHKWNPATQSYEANSYDEFDQAWSDPAMSLPPGQGFMLHNPGAAFSLTFTGCEPDCGPRCPPTNGWSLVGRTSSATNDFGWEQVFDCPPRCGMEVHVFNPASQSMTVHTYLNSGWTPTAPSWPAGMSVFVRWQANSNCVPPCPSGELVLCAAAENSARNAVDGTFGILQGGAGYAAGKIGQAFALNGPSDQVVFAHTGPLLLNSSFSFEAWVNAASLANAPVVFEKGAAVGNRVGLQVFADGTVCGYFDGGTCTTYTGPGEVAANVWTHLALVHDCSAGRALVYVNGVLKNSLPAASPPAGSTAPLRLGASGIFPGHEFLGRLDEVSLYTRALSGTEVAAHAASTNSQCTPCTNELRFACAGTTNHVFTAGGTNDNFAGPEPASPSPGLASRFTTRLGFDECPASAVFAHTFSNLPPCITSARLCVRLKACGDGCADDSISLAFANPSGQLLPPGYWHSYLGAGNPGPGLIPHNWCNTIEGEIICLDLANLPPNLSGGPRDLIAALNQHGFLDLAVSEETAVDWVRLEVESCCCHEDIEVPNDPGLCSAVVPYVPPTPIGGCGANVVLTCVPPPGVFPVGTTTVTCVATNEAGQSATCTFRVTVRDTEPPTLTACPTNRTLRSCAAVTPDLRGEVWFTDCALFGVTVHQTPPPGTPLAVGVHNIVFDVRDAAGNGVGCLTQITVQPPATPSTLGLFNTGVDNAGAQLPFGANDTHYAAVASPVGVIGPIALNSHPAWVPDASSTASRWINIGTSSSSVAGTYVYRLTLNLASVPEAERGCLVLRGRWTADNGVELWLNGVLKASRPVSYAYRTWAPLVLSGLPNTAAVSLEFRVQDDGSHGGLRVEWQEVFCGGCSGGANPTILTQPSGHILSAAASGAVALSYAVVAGGSGPLAYQWYHNGVPLVNDTNTLGADTPTLTHTLQQIPGRLQVNEYYCEVSNDLGMTASQVAITSNFQVTGPTLGGGQMQLSFPTSTNGMFVVERSVQLGANATWTPVGPPMPGTGAMMTHSEPIQDASGFRRVRYLEWPEPRE